MIFRTFNDVGLQDVLVQAVSSHFDLLLVTLGIPLLILYLSRKSQWNFINIGRDKLVDGLIVYGVMLLTVFIASALLSPVAFSFFIPIVGMSGMLYLTRNCERIFLCLFRQKLKLGTQMYGGLFIFSVASSKFVLVPIVAIVALVGFILWKYRTYFELGRIRRLFPKIVEQIKLNPLEIKVTSVVKTVLGYEIKLRLTAPTTIVDLEKRTLEIATAYRVARVRVVHEALDTADICSVLLDLSVASQTTEVQIETKFDLDPMRDLDLGLDINEQPVMFNLCYKSMLIGGIPGSGKSNFIKLLLSYLVTSENTQLFAIDPKRTELVQFKDAYTKFVSGSNINEIKELLQYILDQIDLRATYLATTGKTKMIPTAEYPLIVLIIDELAELSAFADNKQSEQVQLLLRKIVALGRAFCVSGIYATQRPSSINVDTNLRAIISDRFALRCSDRSTAEMILGIGTFSDSDLTSPFVGKVLATDGGPCKAFQSYEITDDFIADLMERYKFAHLKPVTQPPASALAGAQLFKKRQALFTPRLKPLIEMQGTTQEMDDARKQFHAELDQYRFGEEDKNQKR